MTLKNSTLNRIIFSALIMLAVISSDSTALAARITKQDKTKLVAYEIEYIRMYSKCPDQKGPGENRAVFFDFDAIPLVTQDRVVWIPFSIIQKMSVKKDADGFKYMFVLGDGTKLKGFTAKKHQEIGIGKNFYFIGASDFGKVEIQARSVKEIVFNIKAETTYNARQTRSHHAAFIPKKGRKEILNSVHFFCIDKDANGCMSNLFISETLNFNEKGNSYQIPLDNIAEIHLDQKKDPSWKAVRVISTKGNQITGVPKKARYLSGVQQIGGYRLNVMIPLEHAKRAKIIINP
jgi:hypothetical protein